MKRALISVYDKTGIIPFTKKLIELGYEIISTGGTFKLLTEAGCQVRTVESITGFPEIFEGRLKTLHPLIHGGLLGKKNSELHQKQALDAQIDWIDIVVVNLYPFYETMTKINVTEAEIIENIDIGGPAMIRSAAKNHDRVCVITNPVDFDLVIDEIQATNDTTLATRRRLAAKAFSLTAEYDAMISRYFQKEEYPEKISLPYTLNAILRYGENPHQSAALYETKAKVPFSVVTAQQLHGKQLSYNNIQDGNAALFLLKEFTDPTVIALKHMNPCGLASDNDIGIAWQKAYQADPISIFGGIVASNREVTLAMAKQMAKIFLEIIMAPAFEPAALKVLMEKKNIRLLTFDMGESKPSHLVTTVRGGVLMQSSDDGVYESLTFPTEKKPTEAQLEQLLFAYKIVKHVKSNAIVLTKDNMTVGIGAGQMNRVGAAKIAIEQAKEQCQGAVMASDAFFPMNDTVSLAIENGIVAIIQPGGSIKDQDSIDVCNQKGVAMVFTFMRHFKH
jgi:phosphoribosylaminoimidazolecarboxamide formyltransferase/IMP cyclohydrolase